MFRFRCKYHRLRQLQALLHHYPPASMYSHSLHSPIADPGSDFYFTATNIEKPVLIYYKKRKFLYLYWNIYWAQLDEYKSGCIICVLEREKEGRVVRLCLTGLTGSSARGESLGWSALIKLSLNCGQAGPGTAQTRKYKYFHIRVRVKTGTNC